jgi:hypothetical protein
MMAMEATLTLQTISRREIFINFGLLAGRANKNIGMNLVASTISSYTISSTCCRGICLTATMPVSLFS